ncbi:hypothetical protein Sango_0966500, partial [Sesamum angolense]
NKNWSEGLQHKPNQRSSEHGIVKINYNPALFLESSDFFASMLLLETQTVAKSSFYWRCLFELNFNTIENACVAVIGCWVAADDEESCSGHLLFSQKIYSKLSTTHFHQSPLLFCLVYQYFSTKVASKCTSGEKFKLEVGTINGLNDALSVYKKMVKMNPQPCVREFNKLLSHIVKLKECSTALFLFKDIRFLGIPVSEYTMSIAINSYCISNRVDYGFSLLGWFFKLGYVPSATTFSPLLKGLFRGNRIDEAQELFKKIVSEELCQLNVVVVWDCDRWTLQGWQYCQAFELFRVMERGSCMPDTYIYSTLINGLCKDKLIDPAVKLFYEMLEKGVVPDVVTYTSLLHGLCSLSRLQEAKS